MPSKQKIKEYWVHYLLRLGKIISISEFFEYDSCFACGFEGYVERCHITARLISKDDSPSNLHLLCKFCHMQSEHLGDYADNRNDYWQWFCSMTFLRRQLQAFTTKELMNLAKSCITESDNISVEDVIGSVFLQDQQISSAQKFINPDYF